MLRSTKERVFQAVLYEAIGLALLTPAYSFAMGLPLDNSFITMAWISTVVVVWSAIYNAVFDRLLLRWTGRPAHLKTFRIRLLHSALYEASITIFAVPIIAFMSGEGWFVAFIADLGFTAVYFGYTYLFHLVYDRVRPVRAVK
ncbi:PACE efflux transporter [Parvibaculum sp.]|uniref:PACE efflux transporter n=1 Tax=Parvibaculum sp. TaxID=2024848 RepID=UPI002CDCFEC4|nr:PACE efflux transporter [Parvibaculum sp.]HUD52735.1 PACE efflux transporter [Parvibaculum sp.]